jgi:hypothetical protein
MDSRRRVDIDRLHEDIDMTRASISRTAGDLRRKAGEAMEWQTYLERYPASILAGAALVGAAVGRRIARGVNGRAHRDDRREWMPVAAELESVVRLPAQLSPAGEPLAAANASWQRLGLRVEGLVNRIIDGVVDATERVLVPSLVASVEAFLGARNPRSYRPASPDRTSSGAEEGRSR